MCACKIFSLWSKIFSQSMKPFQISLQKPGAVCCGPQLSCGSGLHKLPDFVLGFFFYFLGSCNLFTQAHRKLGSLPVSWEALFGNYLEQQLQLPKEVHAESPTTEQKDFWSHFWCPYSKSPKGLALLGQADGPWQMTEQNLCSALQGFPFFPFQLSCLLLLSAFPSLPVTLGQMRISAAELLCISYAGTDCYASWCCVFCLKSVTSAQAGKRIGSACQGSCCLKDIALSAIFWEKLVIRLVHWRDAAFTELNMNMKLNTCQWNCKH